MKMLATFCIALLVQGVAANKLDAYEEVIDAAAKSRVQKFLWRQVAKAQEGNVADAHKSAGLIQYQNAVSANVAMNTELVRTRTELMRASATAKAETSSSMHLKAELAKATKMQYALRARLSQVSTETRKNLAELLKQLTVAKAAAQRSEALLREEIKEEAAKLKIAEKTELDLRNQLASAEVSATVARSTAAATNAKAVAQLEASHKALNKLHEELKNVQEAHKKEVVALNEKLAQTQQSDTKEQNQLKQQIQTIQAGAVKVKRQLESRIKEFSNSVEKAKDDLETERFTEKLLLANVTSTKEEAELAAAKFRKEHMGLLVQVSDLQEQSKNAQKRVALAEEETTHAKEEAEKKAKELATAAGHKDTEHQRRISALLQETQVAHNNLTFAANAARQAQQQVLHLQEIVEREGEQLRVALLESDSVKAARDAASKGEATFQRMDMTAEASLNETRQVLTNTQNELQSMKEQLASHISDASTLSAKCKKLQAQLSTLQQTSANAEAKMKQQMHDTMISAAAKVHELEDQNEQLSNDLQKEKQELAVASAESAKAKDTLIQQTDASLKASQHAESLQTTLNQMQKEADASTKRVDELTRQASALREERDRNKQASLAGAAAQTELQAKVEALEDAKQSQQAQIKETEAEDKKLKTQVHDLAGEESRADELEEELSNLRQANQRKDVEESQMAKKLEILRSLKDHYSAENEDMKKETVQWHQKVEDLADDLAQTKKKLEKMTRQRAKALLRAKQARSQEDEYFEENARLQQQDEALNSKLVEIGAAANRTNEENSLLQGEIDELKSEQEREKDNSKAALEQNKGELQQAREELKESDSRNDDIRSQLLRMQAVLSDNERRTLGLPPLQKEPAPTVKPKVMASPVLAETSAPSKKVLAQQSRHEMTPPQTKTATQLAQLPGEPPKPTDDAAATLASVTQQKAPASGSALQKLTAFFASPIVAA